MTVAFDYPKWVSRYPEFNEVDSVEAQAYFDEATLYCDNSGSSRITNTVHRLVLLNMLTAHIASLNSVNAGGRGSENLVGRISSATEGSVSVSLDNQIPGSASWFAQTKYGYAYWQATAQYRTARIHRGASRVQDPWAARFSG